MKRKNLHLSDSKKSNSISAASKISYWQQVPILIWNRVDQYLQNADYLNTFFVSTYFSLITLNREIKRYQQCFGYSPIQPCQMTSFNYQLFQNVLKELHNKRNLYYSLHIPSYAGLFELVERSESKAAQAFIQQKLIGVEKEVELYGEWARNIPDLVFCLTNSRGETVIAIAARLGLQDFLNFCFKELIVNNHQLKLDKSNLIGLKSYQEMLMDLDSEMQEDALWWYGCAWICNQRDICQAVSEKASFNLNYSFDGLSITMVAAWLSSVSLLNIASANRVNVSEQCVDHVRYDDGVFGFFSDKSLWPIDVAIISKNTELTEQLKPFSTYGSEQLFNSIEHKDLATFLEGGDSGFFINELSTLSGFYYNLRYENQLYPMDAVIMRNWPEAVKILVKAGYQLHNERAYNGGQYENPLSLAIEEGHSEIVRYLLESKSNPNGFSYETQAPIFSAIRKNKPEIVKLLVEYKANLKIENGGYDKVHRYPLVSAALYNNHEIVDCLIENIDTPKAISQFWNVAAFFKDRSTQERTRLKNVYDQLAQKNPFRL